MVCVFLFLSFFFFVVLFKHTLLVMLTCCVLLMMFWSWEGPRVFCWMFWWHAVCLMMCILISCRVFFSYISKMLAKFLFGGHEYTAVEVGT